MSRERKPGFAAVRRSWRIMDLLARRFDDGMSNSELAEALGESRPTVSRDLDVLRDEGLARKLENGRFGLTAKPMQLFLACLEAHERRERRWQESLRNITAGAGRYRPKEEA